MHVSKHRRPLALLTLLVLLLCNTVQAEGTTEQIAREEIVRLSAGSVFEIVGSGNNGDAWSWTLSKDDTFVEAGRENVFHVRLLDSGTYLLQATNVGSDGVQSAREIPIEVQGGASASSALPSDLIVVADPAFTPQGIHLPAGRNLLKLTPTGQSESRLQVDLNTTSDADGDGKKDNDDDTSGTLFATDGNPLFVWFPRLATNQSIVIKGELAAKPVSALIPITADDIGAVTPGVASSAASLAPGDIHVNIQSNGDVIFALPVETDRQDMILYRWDFGDGHQSLRDVPTHRYFAAGTYTVKGEAVDMRSGKTVTSAERSITISTSDLQPGQQSSSEGSNAASSSAASQGNTSSATVTSSGGFLSLSTLWTILQLLGVAILAIAVGVGLSWLAGKALRRFREKSPASVTEKTAATVDLTAPPASISLRKGTPSVEAKVSRPVSKPPPPPDLIDESAAPAWLMKGLAKAPAESEPTPAPAPAAPATSVEAPAAPVPPEPIPQPDPAPTTNTVETENVPPWLQQTPPAPIVESTTPVEIASPPPTEAPYTEPEDSVPPWLSAGMDAPMTPPEPQTPAEPPAAPPAPEPSPNVTPAFATEPSVQPIESAPTPIETSPVVAATPEPVATVPAPAPAPVIPVEAVSAPAAVAEVASVTPAAESITPVVEPVAPAPVIEQTLVAPVKSAPVVIAPQAVPVQTPAALDASTKTALSPEEQERERERRRKKRQRYRENLKKRQTEQGTKTTSPTAGKAPVTPVAPTPNLTAPSPVPSNQSLVPSPQPQPILPQENPGTPSKTFAPSDDKVAFVIRADSITPPTEPKDDEAGDVGHP